MEAYIVQQSFGCCLHACIHGLCLKYINIKSVCTVPLLVFEASLIIEH